MELVMRVSSNVSDGEDYALARSRCKEAKVQPPVNVFAGMKDNLPAAECAV
jgi:hypothetical protein